MPPRSRIVALLVARNDADVVSLAIRHLVENGIEVYLVDERSTDGTAEEAARWLGRGLLGIERFPPDEEAGAARRVTAALALELRLEELARKLPADWLIHQRADEFRESPWPGIPLAETIAWVDRLGFNAVSFRVLEFVPLDDTYRAGMDPRAHFLFHREAGDGALPVDCWKVGKAPVSLRRGGGGGIVEFAGRSDFPIPFLLRRYRERSLGPPVDRSRSGELPGPLPPGDGLRPYDADRIRLELLREAGGAVTPGGEEGAGPEAATLSSGPAGETRSELRTLRRAAARARRQARDAGAAANAAHARLAGLAEELERLTRRVERLDAAEGTISRRLGGLRQAIRRAQPDPSRRSLRERIGTWLRGGPRADTPLELVSGTLLEQELPEAGGSLHGIALELATLGRENACTLRLTLNGAEGVLRVAEVEGSDIRDGEPARFWFDEVAESGPFRLALESPDGLAGCALGVLLASGQPGVRLFINGAAVDGRLPLRLLREPPSASERAASLRPWSSARTRIRMQLDHPILEGLPVVGGVMDVDGWAFGTLPVAAVEVLVDDVVVVTASHGYVRRDVARAYPEQPGSGSSGFHGVLDLAALREGPHTLEVRARALDGTSESVRGDLVVSHTAPALPHVTSAPDWNAQYRVWIERHEVTSRALELAAAAGRALALRPRFGLVLAVRDPRPALLRETLDSIRSQVYPELEIVLVDDASKDPAVVGLLDQAGREEPRLRVLRREEPAGEASALASGLAASGADYVALVTAEDVLSPLALHALAKRLNERPQADVLYSDSDRVTPTGERWDPAFKPDWSPRLLLATDYLRAGLLACRRSLLVAAGGIDTGLPGAHAYDLALRVTERTAAIEHIPEVLYSERLGKEERRGDRSPYLRGGEREALEHALERRRIEGTVEATPDEGIWRVRRTIPGDPLVSVLIPTASTKHVGRAVRSLVSRTRYPHYEVLILDTSRGRPEVRDLLAALRAEDGRVRSIEDPRQPFSFAATNNLGAAAARGSLLLALNDDTEVLEPDWLGAMVEAALDPAVGVVGARLLYPSGRVQHAGVVLGIGEIAGHAFRHFPAEHPGYLRLAITERDVAAATFACALVRREAWERCSGLDEVNLPLSYNDVDFCLRVREAGYRIVYTPYARLLHFESATRGGSDAAVGHAYMRRRWRRELARDPFYNPNLSLRSEDWSIDLEDDRG